MALLTLYLRVCIILFCSLLYLRIPNIVVDSLSKDPISIFFSFNIQIYEKVKNNVGNDITE